MSESQHRLGTFIGCINFGFTRATADGFILSMASPDDWSTLTEDDMTQKGLDFFLSYDLDKMTLKPNKPALRGLVPATSNSRLLHDLDDRNLIDLPYVRTRNI